MVQVRSGVDVSLAGQVVHPLIHLALGHLGHVGAVDLLARYPVVPVAAPDGGEDPEGLRTGGDRETAGLLGRRRSLLEPREGLEGLDVSDGKRLALDLVLRTARIGETFLAGCSLVEVGETCLSECRGLTLQSRHPRQEITQS